MQTQQNTFCLFEGRHTLPPNSGGICSGFNFETMQAIKTPLWETLLNNGGSLLVTGLTPALTHFLGDWRRKWYQPLYGDVYAQCYGADVQTPILVLMHFSTATGTYINQMF